MATKFLGITIPAELYDEIEEKRKDIPRSYYYKKLLESSCNSSVHNILEGTKHE